MRASEASLAEAAGAPLQGVFMTSGGPQSTPDGIAMVARFCEQRRLPAVADVASLIFRTAGVATYSPDFSELGVRGASFVDRIFRGAKPGELPIEHPTKFDLILNLKTAQALRVTLPKAVVLRADHVISR